MQLANGVTLLAKNGKVIRSDSWFGNQKKIILKNGYNQILVEYSAEIKEPFGDDEVKILSSYIIDFNGNNEIVHLSIPVLESHHDFEAFKINPEWRMINSDGVVKKITINKLNKEGFQLGRNYEKELAVFNSKKLASSIDIKPSTDTDNNTIPIEGCCSFNKSQLSKVMLRYWYINASKNVREDFIFWSNHQYLK
ncbi:DUF2057 domain-containing protein [Neptunomonas sp.]|uniref:DUF2057 domain-containing protein n=1 Tax=Neptunomonas sp. TaxID=1971898 RepID=UPI0025F3AC18|nr:DUF2057 domain-containing protein [Neptunomonas sp.]